MDSAVQHCWGPRGTVNGRLLDAQKQIRCATRMNLVTSFSVMVGG
jgi:hypothetical protein